MFDGVSVWLFLSSWQHCFSKWNSCPAALRNISTKTRLFSEKNRIIQKNVLFWLWNRQDQQAYTWHYRPSDTLAGHPLRDVFGRSKEFYLGQTFDDHHVQNRQCDNISYQALGLGNDSSSQSAHRLVTDENAKYKDMVNIEPEAQPLI